MGRRGIYAWLIILGLAVLMLIVGTATGGVATSVAAAAILMYLAVAFIALGRLPNLRVPLEQIRPSLTVATRTSPAAKKAAQRARNRGDFTVDNALLDIGVLVNEQSSDGRWNRRVAEGVSKDDGAIQPYINLHVAPGLADRLALIEFEVYDQAGRKQFSHTMQTYVRDGENLISCERQLPMRGNTELGRAGTWDLRVKADGILVGLHSFGVAPSTAPDRSQAIRQSTERLSDTLDVADQDEPISLEDLLRAQRNSQR